MYIDRVPDEEAQGIRSECDAAMMDGLHALEVSRRPGQQRLFALYSEIMSPTDRYDLTPDGWLLSRESLDQDLMDIQEAKETADRARWLAEHNDQVDKCT